MHSAAVLLAADKTAEFANQTYERKEYKDIPGTETTVKLFLSLPRANSGIPDLDEEESVWQINWARIHEPPTQQSIHSKDGNAFGSKQPFAMPRCNTHCIWGGGCSTMSRLFNNRRVLGEACCWEVVVPPDVFLEGGKEAELCHTERRIILRKLHR